MLCFFHIFITVQQLLPRELVFHPGYDSKPKWWFILHQATSDVQPNNKRVGTPQNESRA